ncbi:MAG TPA: ATP-binding protein, partial [Lysobacter sp.]|nr:ATP-binding protein [Lysobacter sp.]
MPGDDSSPQALRAQIATLTRERDQARAAMAALERESRQWATHSRYKSEFLANMSHELRTPLNSLLILAQLLAENAAGNLTAKQVEYAQTIRVSGNDLLALIDDILDLSKVESGAATLSIDWVSLPDLGNYLEHIFREVARERGLAFSIAMDERLPAAIRTDRKRLQQILQNLLAIACKFTAHGAVSLRVSIAAGGWTPGTAELDTAASVIAFAVVDSGIGVAQDKQQLIFEAFRQADGSASRSFEGTGLGLSISTELARLLGGEIRIDSSPGEGSTFTLYLPLTHKTDSAGALTVGDRSAAGEAPDDRHRIRPGDRVVLNVAQDGQLAAMLLRQVRALGFKALSAANTHSALALTHEYLPNVVTVGVRARDTSGWAGVHLLRKDLLTRHIPLNVVAIDAPARVFTCLGSLGI